MPVLLKVIKSQDGSSSYVAESLGKIVVASQLEVAPIVEELLPLLDHKEAGLRSAGATAIGRLPSKGCEAAIPALAMLTEDLEDWPRSAAFVTLAKHGKIAGSAAGRLVVALDEPINKNLRESIIVALGASAAEPKTAVPALAKMLAEEDRLARVSLKALGQYGAQAKPAVAAISKFLDHGEVDMRKIAAEALLQIGPSAAEAVPALIKVVRTDPEIYARISAANTLLAVAPDNADALGGVASLLTSDHYALSSWLESLKDKSGVVLAAGMKHQDAAVRTAALKRLSNLDDQKAAVPAYLEAIKDQDAKVRALAAAKLMAIGGHAAAVAPVLVDTLGNEDEDTRKSAESALRQMERGALPALTAALTNPKTNVSVQANVCRLFADRDLASSTALRAIVALRESKDEELHAWATIAAAALDDRERQSSLLLPLLKSKQPALRSAALKQVAQIGGERRIDDEATVALLISFLSDEDEPVRSVAAAIVHRCQFAKKHAPALAAALVNETSREATLTSLKYANVPFQEIIAPLTGILKGNKASHREIAGRILTRIGQPAVAPLLSVVRDAEASPDSRGRAVAALGDMQELPADAQGALAELVGSEDARLRIAAATALAQREVADPKVLAALVAAITLPGKDENDNSLLESAEQGLTRLRDKASPAIPQVTPLLKHKKLPVRRAAANILVAIGPNSDEAIEALVGVMVTDKEVAQSLVYYFTQAKDKAIPRLVKALQNDDVRVVRDVCKALGYIGVEAASALPELKQLLPRKDSAAVAAAAAIVRIDPKTDGLLPALTAALDSQDAGDRASALNSLSELKAMAAPATPQLIAMLRGEDAVHAANVLAEIGPPAAAAVPALIKRLKSGENFYVWARALGAIGPQAKEAAPLLAAQLKNEDNYRSVIDALAGLGPAADAAIPMLTELLMDPQRAADVAERLTKFGARAAPAYLAGLKHEDEKIRALAAARLMEIGGHSSALAPVLLETLSSPDEQQRQAANQALHDMGRRALPAYRAALADSKATPIVQANACRMLADTRISTSQTRSGVAALTSSADSQVRAWATIAAAALSPNQRNEASLAPLLKAENPDIRVAALKKLGSYRDEWTIDDEPRVALVIHLLSDNNEEVRRCASQLLGRCKLKEAHAPAVAAALANQETRIAILEAYMYRDSRPPQGLTAALIDCLDVDKHWQRRLPIRMLGRIGQPAVAPLLAVALDPKAASGKRELAITALGQIEGLPRDVLKSLGGIVNGTDERLKIAAAAALAEQEIAHPKVLAALVSAIAGSGKDDNNIGEELAAPAFVRLGSKGAAAIPQLTPLLKDKDVQVRRRAADTLFTIGEDSDEVAAALVSALEADAEIAESLTYRMRSLGAKGVTHLVRLLDSKDARVLRDASRALGYCGPRAALAAPKLQALLSRKDDVSVAAAAAIVSIDVNVPGPLPVLIAALDSKDKSQQRSALLGLTVLKEKAAPATERLVKMLDGEDGNSAANALGAIGPPAATAAVPLLRKGLEAGKDYYEWINALGAMGPHAKDAVPYLMTKLNDDRVMRTAAAALARMGPPGEVAIPVLLTMLQDETTAVEAAQMLARFGPRSAPAVSALSKLVASDDDQLAIAATVALGEIGPPALPAISELMKVVETGSPHSMGIAARAVGQIKPVEIIPRLIALLSGADDDRSNAAAKALQGFGPAASAAVDALIKNLANAKRTSESIATLEAIGPAAAPAVKILAAKASDSAAQHQYISIRALGGIGPAAAPALPQLEAQLKSAPRNLHGVLVRSIWKIDPSRATALGLKKPENAYEDDENY